MTITAMTNLTGKVVLRFSLMIVFLGLIILLPAGTFNYWEAYAYIVTLVIPMIFVLNFFLRNDPKFLERRIKTREKEKTQKIVQFAFTFVFLSSFIISGLDRRYNWSDIPVMPVLLTDIIILCGYLIVFFVFKQNSYASRVVEVDPEQKVITNGLYSIVRHPMYSGILIMWVPTPIALGSYWGLIPMAAIPIILVFRILNEESVLSRDLAGYKDYCSRTKYRLIPFLW